MLSRQMTRLAEMDLAEIGWRSRTLARNAAYRVLASGHDPRWDRRDLARALAPLAALNGARAALTRGDWWDAHCRLAGHLAGEPARFVIAGGVHDGLARRIRGAVPGSAASAAACADRIVSGQYDLLGYRRLRFHDGAAPVDWHADPVHGRRAPRAFWTKVPYLDPACGDHKIIWELNRHQHWLALGRAFWLTGHPKYRDRCLTELAGWLDANPPLVGINWASMLELGLRSISWIWTLHLFLADAEADRSPWVVDLLLALDRQLTEVEHNLSYYFSPNTHLLGEALALYVAGRSLPILAAGPRRERIGRGVLVDEIDRQILPDGVHCERSTHYHRYTLDFYVLALAIARITDDPAATRFEDAVRRLAAAARSLADDGGRLPHIGDDDGGMLLPIAARAPDDIRDSLAIADALVESDGARVASPSAGESPRDIPEEAFWMLSHPALGASLHRVGMLEGRAPTASMALPDAGYYVSRAAGGHHLVLDGGAHGYRNAGHAHSDALAFTLSIEGGHALLIDAGTGCYTIDPDLRDLLRSTALHNTLVVDGRPQSLPAGPFAWSSTTDSRTWRWQAGPGFDYFEGAHDGYRPIEHRRHLLVVHGNLVLVADLVTGGSGIHTAAVHWHIDPRWTASLEGRLVRLSLDQVRSTLVLPQGQVERFSGDRRNGLGWHAPEYGRLEPATTIRVTRRRPVPFWVLSVIDLSSSTAQPAVRVLPVRPTTGGFAHRVAIRVARAASADTIVLAEPVARDPVASWRAGGFESEARVFWAHATGGHTERVVVVER